MRSSTAQMNEDFDRVGIDYSSTSLLPRKGDQALSSFGQALRFPIPEHFDPDAARLAGRMSAASVSSAEFDSLIAEHSTLVSKSFEPGGLSKVERRRLIYVRWNLDQIEDALHGAELDRLEMNVVGFEQLCTTIDAFTDTLKAQRVRKQYGPQP